jgi:hypothetical protein
MNNLRLVTAVALVAFVVNVWTLSLYQLLSPFSSRGIGGSGSKIPMEMPPTELETILERLQLGNIVFNAPVTLQRGRWEVIQLVLSYKDSIDKQSGCKFFRVSSLGIFPIGEGQNGRPWLCRQNNARPARAAHMTAYA